MRILFNTGTNPLHWEFCARSPDRFGWLTTLSTGKRKLPQDLYYACDNGCFQRLPEGEEFVSYVAHYDRAAWVVLPDVVGDAQATYSLSREWRGRLESAGLHRRWAYVLQDGFTLGQWPDWCDVAFLGGSTEYKMSRDAMEDLRELQRRGIYTHIGRVNTERRLNYFRQILKADSVDGTNFTKFVHNPTTRRIIRRHELQLNLF